MEPKPVQRRYDLDWLRVFGILTVFVYHSNRFFNLEDWHVKNASTYLFSEVLNLTAVSWMMPLIFAISGASLFYALGKGGAGKFIKDKVLRLAVPLVAMGMVVFGALQMYLEGRSHGEFSGSFFAYLPEYFQPAHLAWWGVHLWYLRMLFTFCILFLPVFLWLKRASGQRVLAKLGDWLSARGAVYLLALPTILCLVLTDRESYWGDMGWGGGSILSHATFFLSGFLIVSHEGLQKNIRRARWLSLVLVLVLWVAIFSVLLTSGEPSYGTPTYTLAFILWGLWSWCWVLAILGFGTKYLNINNHILPYANEAVLPFYILHQPVLLSIGYFVVQWPIPDFVKWMVILASSFIVILSVYEFLVRRINFLRLLFGMKPRRKVPAVRPVDRPLGEAA